MKNKDGQADDVGWSVTPVAADEQVSQTKTTRSQRQSRTISDNEDEESGDSIDIEFQRPKRNLFTLCCAERTDNQLRILLRPVELKQPEDECCVIL